MQSVEIKGGEQQPLRGVFLKYSWLNLIGIGGVLVCLLVVIQVVHNLTSPNLLLRNQIIKVAQKSTLITANSLGNEYHVSPRSCNNSWSGTINEPRCSINSGISLLNPGDILYVHAGIYKEVVYIGKSGTAQNPITITGYENDAVVVDGDYQIPTGTDWDPLVKISGSYIIFKNIEVTESNGEGISLEGAYSKLDNVYMHHNHEAGAIMTGDYSVVENCRVYYNSMHNENGNILKKQTGSWGSGISAARSPKFATIRNTTVWNNWGEGMSTFGARNTTFEDNVIYDNWSVNMYIQNAQNVLVQRNLVYRTLDNIFTDPNVARASETGIVEDNEGPDSGYGFSSNNIYVNNIVYGTKGNFVHWSDSPAMSNTLIAHNTFVNASPNSYNYANVEMRGNSTNVRFFNNIIVQDDVTTIANIGNGIEMSHNAWSKTPPLKASGTNDVVGDPQLVRNGDIVAGSVTGEWFALKDTSPAIDKALSLKEVVEDYYTIPRDGNPDIGAHEYTEGASPRPSGTPTLTPTPTLTQGTPLVSPTRTPTPTTSSTFLKRGDLNGDDLVTIFDVILEVDMIFGNAKIGDGKIHKNANTDINGDGVSNLKDALEIITLMTSA